MTAPESTPDGSLPTVEQALATPCCDEHPECSHTYEVWERHRIHGTHLPTPGQES